MKQNVFKSTWYMKSSVLTRLLWVCWLRAWWQGSCCQEYWLMAVLWTLVQVCIMLLHLSFTECDHCDKPGYICDPDTGRCVCPPLTTGPVCDQCQPGSWGYEPGKGCKVWKNCVVCLTVILYYKSFKPLCSKLLLWIFPVWSKLIFEKVYNFHGSKIATR